MKNKIFLMIIIINLIFVCGNKDLDDISKFDDFSYQWYSKQSILLEEALKYLSSLNNNPTSDGVLYDLISTLLVLPFNDNHTPYIIAILNKNDVYLNEAGVRLATASANRLNNHDKFEESLCRLMQKESIDPWIFYEINNFYRTTNYNKVPEILKFYHDYAACAYDFKKEKNHTNSDSLPIMRQRMIIPFIEARGLIENDIINCAYYSNKIQTLINVIEKVYNKKGYENIKKFLESKYKK